VTDEGLLKKSASEQRSSLEDPSKATNLLKLQAIHQFQSTAEGVEEITALSEGKISKTLKKFLVDEVQGGKKKAKDEQLVVSDPKLGK
jgi:nucleolar protein 58